MAILLLNDRNNLLNEHVNFRGYSHEPLKRHMKKTIARLHKRYAYMQCAKF